MPGVSDPGQVLVRYAIDNEVQYDVLPGANALLTAFVASGFVETKMLFYGFLDHKGDSRSAGLEEALHNGFTTILYESPHRLEKLLLEIAKAAPTREIFLAKELTKKFQRYVHGTAEVVLAKLDKNFKGEWVVVIQNTTTVETQAITIKDLNELKLPPKQKAKLLSKLTGKNIKDIYTQLVGK
jgi:16S rRNA (cytidine1402-2'-O)-methyltransferase